MKKILVVFTVIAVLGLSSFDVRTLPYGNPAPLSLFQPSHWYAQESGSCPYGYQCYYNIWTPSITLNYPVWVFGITNNAGKGGLLHFREYPATDCHQSCISKIPLL